MATKKTKSVTNKQKPKTTKKQQRSPLGKSKKSAKNQLNIKAVILAACAAVLIVLGIYYYSNSNNDSSGKVASTSSAASMAFSSSADVVKVGDTFAVTIIADSAAESANAVQASVTYPADKVELKEVKSQNSGYPIQAYELKQEGLVELTRGVISGVTGEQVVTVLDFVALKEGDISFAYNEDKTLLVSSTTNTNILGSNSFNTKIVEVSSGQ